MVRVFWLGDDSVGSSDPAADYLPDSAMGALAKLGLPDARVISQGVTSVLLDEGENKAWGLESTAALTGVGGETMQLSCEGELEWPESGAVPLGISLGVNRPNSISMGGGRGRRTRCR